VLTGPLDILLDEMQYNDFNLGQPRDGRKATITMFGVCTGCPARPLFPWAFDTIRYTIDTAIHPDNSLEASASVEFPRLRGLAAVSWRPAFPRVENFSVTGSDGEALPFFKRRPHPAGNQFAGPGFADRVPAQATGARESTFKLHFHYSGNVIEDAGNSVCLSARGEAGIPMYGDSAEFAYYDLTCSLAEAPFAWWPPVQNPRNARKAIRA